MATNAAHNGKITSLHGAKNMIYYTVPEHADSLLIPIKAKADDDKARDKAISEILRRMNDESDTTLDPDSFSDGLDVSKLVVVEPPPSTTRKQSKGGRRSSKRDLTRDPLSPIEEAAANLARFSLVRVNFQEHQETAHEFLPLIEALFNDAPLSEELIKAAKNKTFPRSLSKLASAKMEFDDFRGRAVDAWGMLEPIIRGGARPADLDED